MECSNMLLRYGVIGGLLVIVLWSWGTRSGPDEFEALNRPMLERRGMAKGGDVGEGYSLGLVRTRSLLEIRRFEVPPFFVSLGDQEGATIEDDPFAEGFEPEAPFSRSSAREILRARGIEFKDGAMASYDSDSSMLVVKNRPAQLDLVERFINNVRDEGVPKQIEVTVKFIEITNENLEELGFDWVLPLDRGVDGS